MKEIIVYIDEYQSEQPLETWEKELIADLKAVMKSEGDGKHPAGHYLVVEDPEKSTTWHLRVRDVDGNIDRRLLGGAWAALHGGYRGNKYKGPDKQTAITKLKKLYEGEEMPLPGTKAVSEYVCPECGHSASLGLKPKDTSCPMCGAKMVTGAEADAVGVNMNRALTQQAAAQTEAQVKSADTEDEKAGRRIRGEKVGLLRKLADEVIDMRDAINDLLKWAAYDDQPTDEPGEELEEMSENKSVTLANWLDSNAATKALEEASARGSSLVAFKAADGSDWLLTFTTNAFEDREGEIFTTKSIENYVSQHEDEDIKGEYQFWHLPGSKFGEIKWQGTVGRFLVEAGPFDNTSVGRAFKEFFSANPNGHPEIAPDGWGCSHKYEYKSKDREDSVYEWFDKSETTVLPLDAAANPYTAPLFIKEQTMNERQKEALNLIGGKDLVSMVESVGKKATEELEANVSFKQGDYAAMVRKIASGVEDEKVKQQLMALAGQFGKMKQAAPADEGEDEDEEKYPMKKKQDEQDTSADTEDEKAGGEYGKYASHLRMLAGKLTGADAQALRKIAESIGGMNEDKPMAPNKKEFDEFVGSVGEAFKAVIEKNQSDNTEVIEAVKALTEAVAGIKTQLDGIQRSDDEKFAEKAADTPAASLLSNVQRAIGAKETRVDGRRSYAKDRPRETDPAINGQTGVPLIDMFTSGADQRQR